MKTEFISNDKNMLLLLVKLIKRILNFKIERTGANTDAISPNDKMNSNKMDDIFTFITCTRINLNFPV